jgi:hypothetical protein
MARLPTQGGDENVWGVILNDFLSVEHNTDGTLKKDGDIAQAQADATSALAASQPDTTIQKIEVAQAGSVVGTRKQINFVNGTNVTITAADDNTNNRVNVTVASSAAGTIVEPTTPPPTINTTGSVLGTSANAAHADHTHALVAHTHADTANGGQLLQANTHGTPDTDSAPTALHHTLGTGANQAAVGSHTHTSLARAVSIYSGGAYPARPTDYAVVEFVGPVDPAGLAQEYDTWINTT